MVGINSRVTRSQGRPSGPMTFGHWLGLLALLAALVLLWNLRQSLILVFTAGVIAMAICTLVARIQQRLGCNRGVALMLTLVLLLVLGVVIGTAVIPPFVDQFAELISKLPAAATTLLNLVRDAIASASKMLYGTQDGGMERLRDELFPNGQLPIPNLGQGAMQIVGLAGGLGAGLLQLVFVVAVALMVAVQPVAYREVLVLLVPSFYRRRFRTVLVQCGDALSAWMAGVLISSLCVGVLAAIGLSLLGVNLVAANALLAGMLNVIPNVGPTLSTIFPMSVALLDSPWKSLAVLVLYVVIQNVESYLITPSVMQHQLRLLPGLTLSAQVIFTILFGPIGLLMALPLAVCLQVLMREIVIRDILDDWKRLRQSG